MEILIGAVVAVALSTGGLWYTIGKLVSEVRGHNKRLDKIDIKLDRLINGQGGKDAT
jgi:hypothetical protein